MKKFLFLTLAVILLISIVACNDNATTETAGESATAAEVASETVISDSDTLASVTEEAPEQPTEAPETQETEVSSETSSEVASEASSETPTETPSETEEPVTEAPEPQEMAHVSFDEAVQKGLDPTDYLLRPMQTQSGIVKDGDVSVLSLKAEKKADSQQSDPYVSINYQKLAEAMGGKAVDTTEYPYLVLRVKGVDLWSRTFGLYAYTSNRVQGEGAFGEQKARLKDTDEWQYIRFDLTASSKPLVAFRLDYINATITEDTVFISDLYFCKTEEEAIAMTGPDTYPIKEQTADNYTLNVMSFNVQTENGTQVRMDIRADMLRDLIDEYMPDSIGMQEVTANWRAIMDSYVFNDSYTGVGIARTNNPALGLEQSCIFYRSDKYDLLDSGTFWLSATPEVVGSVFEGSQYPRICTYVHLKDKVTGFEYIHMNTHLDHLGGSDGRALRLKQETVMLQKLATLPNVATVITGDFNQLAFNGEGKAYAVYKLMTGERAFNLPDGTEMTMNLADSRMHAPDNMPEGFTATMTTYHDVNSSKYMPSRYPIDYCFYTPDKLEALSYAIRLFDRDGVFLSDHLPVITSFKVIV